MKYLERLTGKKLTMSSGGVLTKPPKAPSVSFVGRSAAVSAIFSRKKAEALADTDLPAIPAIADPNSENSGHHSTDPVPVPVPTPTEAAAMRLSAIESSGLALLVKVDDDYMVWTSTKAAIPEAWADYPLFTTEELRLIPPGNRQVARDWLALKRTFPGSTWHPVSDTAPTPPPAPAFVTCATCQHYQAGEQGGIGTCAMGEDQRTTDPSERYPAGYPVQAALYPHTRRICTAWETS